MEMKQCSKCKETKPTTEFYKNRSRRDGLQGRCRDCCNASAAAYCASHCEEKRASDAAYYAQIRARILAHYGETCAYDNADCSGGLEIDHMNGGGNEHRKEVGRGTGFYRWLVKNSFPEGLQTLCRYHNHAKSNTPDAEYRRALGLAA
jgi:hypothetical protein